MFERLVRNSHFALGFLIVSLAGLLVFSMVQFVSIQNRVQRIDEKMERNLQTQAAAISELKKAQTGLKTQFDLAERSESQYMTIEDAVNGRK